MVVATHTLPLQEQIVNREWPVAREALRQLGLSVPRLEIARGRGNYVCLRRLFAWAEPILTGHARGAGTPYVPLAVELVGQAPDLKEGLREEFAGKIPAEVWEEIRADPEDCLYHASPYYDRCYVQRARRRLAEAEVVVTNHALYLTDVARTRAGEAGFCHRTGASSLTKRTEWRTYSPHFSAAKSPLAEPMRCTTRCADGAGLG